MKEFIWYSSRGDRSLWKYAQAIRKEAGGLWSEPIDIAAFYKYCKINREQRYSLNLHGYNKKTKLANGNYPLITAKELRNNFKFIDRVSGRVILFKEQKRRNELS